MSSAAASRAVSDVKPKRVSISFKMDVKSRGVCETKFAFDQGETTHRGRRKPEWSNCAEMSLDLSIGGMPSGFTRVIGGTWSNAPPPSSKVRMKADDPQLGLFISPSRTCFTFAEPFCTLFSGCLSRPLELARLMKMTLGSVEGP